jgi:hypothetical protein
MSLHNYRVFIVWYFFKSNFISLLKDYKVKEQPAVRKDMDVNEHERLSNITLRHKLK